ncbi:quinolinate synthase NadA [Fervidobacterium thailandense]
MLRQLAKEKGYLIMAHNYQIPELQRIADFVGDSLQLARQAMETNAERILFLGVDFMAETVKALNPEKKVVVPVLCATCPMANSLTEEEIAKAKEKYDAPFVVYVNSTARTKFLADYLCTSANAVDVVRNVPSDTVLFGPDKNLASYVAEKTGKRVIPIPGELGYCHVHNFVTTAQVRKLLEKYPDAEVMVHPEVPEQVRKIAHFVGSTAQMEKYPMASSAKTFIVVTEVGMAEKLRALYPDRTFLTIDSMVCYNMKKNNLRNTYRALLSDGPEVVLDERLGEKIRKLVEDMLKLTASTHVGKK